MKTKYLYSIFFLLFLTGVAQAQDITLNPSGSNDQNQMNNAISQVSQVGGTVYLNPGVYDIANTINMKSNVKLSGDPEAILRVSASYQWFTGQIGVISNPGESLHDVEICGFQIDGNIGNLPRSYDSTPGHDRDCEKLMLFGGFSSDMGSNISVHDMKLYDSFSDGIYIRFTDGVYIYNNFISDAQHEGYYLSCCRGGSVYNNQIAGICSDNGRLDNCQNFLIENNIFFSFNGESFGAYKHGENSLQIGNQGGSSHGYTPTAKPFTTKNIEVKNNTFISPGLQAFSLSGGDNVYIHDNIFKDASELETLGISVGNYSYDNPPSVEVSEKIFSSIFDILNVNFQDSAVTNQTDDQINYTVQKNNVGNIAGGVKIIGFRNMVLIDNKTYMQDNNSMIVKSDVEIATPLDFWNQGIEKTDKDIKVGVKNGNATATMTVKMKVYSVSYNKATGGTKKSYRTYTATFNDSVNAPDIYPAPPQVSGIIKAYSTYFEVYVHSAGLVKVRYTYDNNYTEHSFLVGERNHKNGIEYTEYTKLEDWSTGLNHTGDWLRIYGKFDRSKLNVTAITPYENIPVTDLKIENYGIPEEPIAFWFYPTLGFLACLYFIGRYFWRRIWF